jgi:hypothetical protein
VNFFQDTIQIEKMLADAAPLPILFSHKCCESAHSLYAELQPHFFRRGMALQLDPFSAGEDVLVKMWRLQIHGLLFHSTPASVESDPCKLEIETAQRIGVATMVIWDGASPPSHLKNRLYPKLPGMSVAEREKAFEDLARGMKPRAVIHTVLQWLHEPARTVEEREDGCKWLCKQPPQVLAEFWKAITDLHRGSAEDNIVCRWLAAALGCTGIHDAREVLQQWLPLSNHPNWRYGIKLALEKLK